MSVTEMTHTPLNEETVFLEMFKLQLLIHMQVTILFLRSKVLLYFFSD